MTNKYVFKGQDITTDVLFKIEHIVSLLSEKEQMPFDDAYAMFAASNTYAALKRPDNLYWAESAEFLVDEYYRENGRLREVYGLYGLTEGEIAVVEGER